MSNNGLIYTILSGDCNAVKESALKVIDRRGFGTPEIKYTPCRLEHHYFCQSCFSRGDQVVPGVVPEWVGQTIMETPATYKMDPERGLAVTDRVWGDVLHPDSA